MSMNLADFETAVLTRLALDTTLMDAVQGVYNTLARPGDNISKSGKPYIVLGNIEWPLELTFVDNIAAITFTLYHVDAIENGRAAISTVMDRTYGDSFGQGGTPTYGLHRHPLVVSGDNVAGTIRCQGGRTEHTDEALVYAVNYAVYLTEGTAS